VALAVQSIGLGTALAAAVAFGAYHLDLDGEGPLAIAVLVAVVEHARPRAVGETWPRPRVLAMATVSVAAVGGVYACVPDTERALFLLAAAVVAATLAVLAGRAWLGAAWALTLAMAWVGVTDGPERDTAVVGVVALIVLHVLAVEALRRGVRSPVGITAVTGGACLLASRVAGISSRMSVAVPVAVAAVVVLLVTIAVAGRAPAQPAGAGTDAAP
jgi:hypothetical protein